MGNKFVLLVWMWEKQKEIKSPRPLFFSSFLGIDLCVKGGNAVQCIITDHGGIFVSTEDTDANLLMCFRSLNFSLWHLVMHQRV